MSWVSVIWYLGPGLWLRPNPGQAYGVKRAGGDDGSTKGDSRSWGPEKKETQRRLDAERAWPGRQEERGWWSRETNTKEVM